MSGNLRCRQPIETQALALGQLKHEWMTLAMTVTRRLPQLLVLNTYHCTICWFSPSQWPLLWDASQIPSLSPSLWIPLPLLRLGCALYSRKAPFYPTASIPDTAMSKSEWHSLLIWNAIFHWICISFDLELYPTLIWCGKKVRKWD